MIQYKQINLVLENCDVISIPGNTIGNFELSNIQRYIKRVAVNSILDYNVANKVILEICSEANTNYQEFNQEDDQFTHSKFDRLINYKDITAIELEYKDGTKSEFYVDYDCETDFEDNKNEKVYLSKLGNLYIVIEKDKTIEDYFDINELNDSQKILFHKNMLNIGVIEYNIQPLTYNNLPDFYRYVYISSDTDDQYKRDALAVRVPDNKLGWKFIYEDNSRELHFPNKWQYCNDKIAEFIDNNNKSFTLNELKEKYSLNKESEEE